MGFWFHVFFYSFFVYLYAVLMAVSSAFASTPSNWYKSWSVITFDISYLFFFSWIFLKKFKYIAGQKILGTSSFHYSWRADFWWLLRLRTNLVKKALTNVVLRGSDRKRKFFFMVHRYVPKPKKIYDTTNFTDFQLYELPTTTSQIEVDN